MTVSLRIPDLSQLRQWLDKMGMIFCESESHKGIHLPHIQNINGVVDAKIEINNKTIVICAIAEVRPMALIPLVGDLSYFNASSLTAKVFIDVKDKSLPRLVVCQSISIASGLTYDQFRHFILEAEDQIAMIMMEVGANNMLMMNKESITPTNVYGLQVLH